MNFEAMTAYCQAKPGATASYPFDEETLVFKVYGRMFALTNVNRPASVTLKCDPEWSHVLRETYAAIRPGYHMNKQHWNTLTLDGTLPEAEVRQLIDHSYDLVVRALKKADRERLAASEASAEGR